MENNEQKESLFELRFYSILLIFCACALVLHADNIGMSLNVEKTPQENGICINLPEQMRIDVQDSIQIFKKIKEERCLNE